MKNSIRENDYNMVSIMYKSVVMCEDHVVRGKIKN